MIRLNLHFLLPNVKVTPALWRSFCNDLIQPHFDYASSVWYSNLYFLNTAFIQSINSVVFKYFTKQCHSYLNEVFELTCPNNLKTRNSYLKLSCPFEKVTWDETHFLSLVPQY